MILTTSSDDCYTEVSLDLGGIEVPIPDIQIYPLGYLHNSAYTGLPNYPGLFSRQISPVRMDGNLTLSVADACKGIRANDGADVALIADVREDRDRLVGPCKPVNVAGVADPYAWVEVCSPVVKVSLHTEPFNGSNWVRYSRTEHVARITVGTRPVPFTPGAEVLGEVSAAVDADTELFLCGYSNWSCESQPYHCDTDCDHMLNHIMHLTGFGSSLRPKGITSWPELPF